jgi:hypothetical protein
MFFLFFTHAECAVKNVHALHAEQALTTSKRVKIFKNLFGNLETGFNKKPREIFILNLALKRKFFERMLSMH